MLFLTHLLFGILVSLVALNFISGGNYLIFFSLVLLGSIFPDIDEKRSKMVKWTGVLGLIISFFFKHRGFFHSLIFTILATLAIKFFWNPYYAWALFLGLTSHLFLDSMSKKGINFFHPFNLEMKGWLRVGSWEETMIQVILVLLIVWKVV